MADSIPFIRGQNVKLRFYQNGRPIYIPVKNWKVSENAAEVADGVNGEKRDRLDKVTNYYEVTFDVYQENEDFMSTIMAAQEVDDAAGLPVKQTFAVQKEIRDGTKLAYICTEGKLGPWEESMTSRADANMIGCKARFRFWRRVPSI
jgi:hypothetical protein